MGELKRVSDSWLASRHEVEKGFSLGFFSERYLSTLPAALVRREGRIVAFANLWETAGCEELSVDLMRYADDAPKGVMDFLFVELMLWGKARATSGSISAWHRSPGSRIAASRRRGTNSGGWCTAGAMTSTISRAQALQGEIPAGMAPRFLAAPGGLALPGSCST